MSDFKKIILLPRYTKIGASSRYRIYQYLEFWKLKKELVSVYPLLDEIQNTNSNYFSLAKKYLFRLSILLKFRGKVTYFIEKELFPFFYDFNFILKLFNMKYILDFDDAIFHNYDNSKNAIVKFLFKSKIPKLIKGAELVITGSPYLTKYASQYNNNVFEIPTSIVFNEYKKRIIEKKNNKFVIGWIGSKTTSLNLIYIKEAIIHFSENYDCEFHLIGFDNEIGEFSQDNIKIIEWNQNTEIEDICQFSVGIMPLGNGLFEQGKCGFKLIQYMACEIPTISSPLEANIKINHENNNLFANSNLEWINSFIEIYNKQEFYKKVGQTNKDIVRKYYSVEKNTLIYYELFKKYNLNF